MAEKITKESIEKVNDKKAPEVKKVEKAKKESTRITRDDAVSKLATLSAEDKEALKKELLQEVVRESGVKEIWFSRTRVPNSGKIAEQLNSKPRRITVWKTDEGEKAGYIEEVKINGAVAQVPKGVSISVPVSVADMIEGYKRAEETMGLNTVNQMGERGIRADRDDVTKSRLDL
jgi:hypothetical protein